MHIKLTCRKSVTSYRVCSRLISSGKDAYQTRDKRGRGVRRRVEADVRLPDSWGESLKEESNKTELILYVRAQQGQGKSTVWATWMSFGDQATIAFMVLSKMPSVQDVLNAMPVLKDWWFCCMTSKPVPRSQKKGRTLENISPTADALVQTQQDSGLPSWSLLRTVHCILNYLLLVNGDGHNLSQMHGSLSGPHRELVK
ncbi:hypothetical protein ACROYT_G043738 [Oculina patagonica]